MLAATLTLLSVLVCAPSDRATELNQQAKAALEKGQAADAVLFLESACKIEPDDDVLRKNLGYAYFMRGRGWFEDLRWDQAAADYRKAAKTDPEQPGYRLHLASLSLRRYRLDETLKELDKVLELDDASAEAWLLRGDCLNLLDRLPEAVEAYERTVELEDERLSPKAERALERTRRQHAVEKDYRTDITSTFIIRHPPGTEFLELAGLLDRARTEVCNDFDRFPSSKAIVVLYPPQDFRDVTGTHDWVGGLFDRKIRLPIGDPKDAAEREVIEQSFRHEYTHLIVSEVAPRCPAVLNEGLAQMAEYGRGQGMAQLVSYLDAKGIARESVPAIGDLPESFIEIADRDSVQVAYLVSFAFVDHVVSQHGMGAAIRWLDASAGESLESAFRAAVGKPLEREESRFRELLRTARG